ncbi:MAG: hypothetical protein AAF919_17140 [Pseudomonadota bacterium]
MRWKALMGNLSLFIKFVDGRARISEGLQRLIFSSDSGSAAVTLGPMEIVDHPVL